MEQSYERVKVIGNRLSDRCCAWRSSWGNFGGYIWQGYTHHDVAYDVKHDGEHNETDG